MTTALYIIGYIIGLFLTIWICYRFIDLDKEDSLAWGFFWPIGLVFGFYVICASAIIWVGDKLVDLWDYLEDKFNKKK